MYTPPSVGALLLVGAASLVSSNPLSYNHLSSRTALTNRGATSPLCHTPDPFFCPLGATVANQYQPEYDSLKFGPVPPGTAGNPATTKFCLSSDCNPSGIISIEIHGDSCNTLGDSDPVVVIIYPELSGYTYNTEHVWVGPVGSTVPNGNGNFPWTSGTSPWGCTTGVTPASCTIGLKEFLYRAGITSCTDDAEHTFNIITHADLNKVGGGTASGTSQGTCVQVNQAGKCAPWFAYGTLTYKCKKCTLCNSCTCPAYVAEKKCQCDSYANDTKNKCECKPDCTCPAYVEQKKCECPNYAVDHKCECTPDCSCPDYAKDHKCECTPDCSCPDYAKDHKCECTPDCSCPDYAKDHKCECTPDCSCPDYAKDHKCECTPDCSCPDYAKDHKCECTPDCSCPDYAKDHKCECTPDCSCPDYAKDHKCQCTPDCSCPDYAKDHKCECTPDCASCPDYAKTHPDICFKWCPSVDTAYGYFDNNPAWQSQFNKANKYGKSLTNKNCQSKWGWWFTFKSSELQNGASYSGRLVAGAGNYNLDASYNAGTFTLAVDGSAVKFSFTSASNKIQFDNLHVQASCSIPSTCAPGQFTNSYSRTLGTADASSGSGLAVTLAPSGCTTSQDLYFIVHASVAKRIPFSDQCSASAPQKRWPYFLY